VILVIQQSLQFQLLIWIQLFDLPFSLTLSFMLFVLEKGINDFIMISLSWIFFGIFLLRILTREWVSFFNSWAIRCIVNLFFLLNWLQYLNKCFFYLLVRSMAVEQHLYLVSLKPIDNSVALLFLFFELFYSRNLVFLFTFWSFFGLGIVWLFTLFLFV